MKVQETLQASFLFSELYEKVRIFVSSDFPTDPRAVPSESWLPGPVEQKALAAVEAPSPRRAWALPVILFLATAISTTYAGLFYVRSDLGFVGMAFELAAHPAFFLKGIPFSFTLMTILLAHEMGHFIACRYYGIACTPPYFIPLPISIVGTMGAFIRIKSPFQHKKALFDVGVAGPLAGFVFVVPALVIGIATSSLIPKTGGGSGDIYFGEPLIFRLVGAAVLGYVPETQDMIASPMAMAAWFGLLATSLNLFPIFLYPYNSHHSLGLLHGKSHCPF